MQLPDAIDRVRPSVVQIRAIGPDVPPPGQSVGTGFVVTGDAHVITALHVVEAIKEKGCELFVAFMGPDIDKPPNIARGAFKNVSAQVLDTNPTHDLAILDVPEANDGSAGTLRVFDEDYDITYVPCWLNTDRLRDGIDLAVSGYPMQEPCLVTNAGILASAFTVALQAGALEERCLGDFTANPGNSGAPVYKVNDAIVIGVCLAVGQRPTVEDAGGQDTGLTLIVAAKEVRALLDKNGLELPQQRRAPPHARQTTRQRRKKSR